MSTFTKGFAILVVSLGLGGSAGAQCPEFVVLDCSSSSGDVELQWTTPTGQADPIEVLRDGQVVATVGATDTFFIDSPPVGVHDYQLQTTCGLVSYTCKGQSGVTATYRIDAIDVLADSTAQTWLHVSSENCLGVTSGSFGVAHDPSLLTTVAVELSGSLAAVNLSAGPSLEQREIFDTGPSGPAGFTFAFVTDLTPPFTEFVPVGSSEELLTITYDVSPLAALGTTTTLDFTDQLGSPLVTVLVGVDGLLIDPTTPPASGVVTVVDSIGTAFVRGDTEGSGGVAISDAIVLLEYLFLGQPLDCLASGDIDAGGSVQITDGILLLEYLFLGNAPPASPFPACGFDTSASAMDCQSATACN